MKIKSIATPIIALSLSATAILLIYKHTLLFQTWFIRLTPLTETKYSGLSTAKLTQLDGITIYYSPLNSKNRSPLQLSKLQRGWQWKNGNTIDRADNQMIAHILTSLYKTKILDSFSLDQITAENSEFSQAETLNLYGINAQSIEIQLALKKPHILQHFTLGSLAPWSGKKVEDSSIKTFYIWSHLDEKIYLLQAPRLDFIKQNISTLRDSSPFFFKNDELKKIEFSSTKENWQLEKTNTDWKASKPYISDINPQALKQLITGISQLKIIEFYPSLTNADYASLATNDFYSLTLGYKTNKQTISESLKLIPVKNPNNNIPYWVAQHSQRAGYFKLKSIGTTEEPGVLNLSLSLKNLQSKLLTQLPPKNITDIQLTYANGHTQKLSQPKPNNWQLTLNSSTDQPLIEKPHPNKLKPFLTSLLAEPTLAIVSEQEFISLAKYGLDKPSLTLNIQTTDNKQRTLKINQAPHSEKTDNNQPKFYAKWEHLNTIFEISEQVYFDLFIPSYQWRSSKLWEFSPLDVKKIIIKKQQAKHLILDYNAFQSQWRAYIGNKDLSTHLLQKETEKLLNRLLNLQSFSWLPRSHQASALALQNPSIKFNIILRDQENPDREDILTLILAPSQANQYNFFYAKITGLNKPNFILKGETVKALMLSLFENTFNAPTPNTDE